MDTSQKEGSKRPRRSRSVAPPGSVITEGVPTALAPTEAEVPRFRGSHAPLATLAGELRRAREVGDVDEVAGASARLSRQLSRRGVELREAIALAQKSIELRPDPSLMSELARAWVSVGDFGRSAQLLIEAAALAAPEERTALLVRAGLQNAHAGKIPQALQALHQAVDSDPTAPEPREVLGAMGFWADFPEAAASEAYLEAARLREAAGQGAQAFEDLLRAFEVDPASPTAAQALAESLIKKGREGAAAEITREHLRHESEARRAAHHERRFSAALLEGKLAEALEAALEAELDVELDAARVEEALNDRMARPTDFESFLVHLASTGFLGDATSYAEWLLSLVDVHGFDWGQEAVTRIGTRVAETFALSSSPLVHGDDPARIRELREELTGDLHAGRAQRLREELGRLEAARGDWDEAFISIEPVISDDSLSMATATLGVLVSGRARSSVGRARALVALGRALPEQAGSVALSVATEALIAAGEGGEAQRAAATAIDLNPSWGRALAAQSQVALRFPEETSAGQLEASLSVLVARGESCQMLARSAEAQGSARLALTWAHRNITLRPGDPAAAIELLQRAVNADDAERTLEALEFIVAQPVPFVEIAEEVGVALRALVEQSDVHGQKGAAIVLEKMGVRFLDCRDALLSVAQKSGSAEMEASLIERQLVIASAASRVNLLLELADRRQVAGDSSSSARALRRALTLGADPHAISDKLRSLGLDLEPDASLASLETRVDLLVRLSPEDTEKQADLLLTLGAARWDMAQDPPAAINAWLKAADLDQEAGLSNLARYLTAIAGPDQAALQLEKAAELAEDPIKKARLLGLSARSLLEQRMPSEAFRLAKRALQCAPLLAENLTLAERAAGPAELDALEALYVFLAESTLGRFGERAIHYRAARLLEKKGRYKEALRHAAEAFVAVPSEGVAFVLMMRLSDRAEDTALAIRALEAVAQSAARPDEKERWLERAAMVANVSAGARQRVDLLLRAAQVRPEDATVYSLGEALAELEHLTSEERAELRTRFSLLVKESLLLAGGAHGAMLCVSLAYVGLTFFADHEVAAKCLEKAVSSDIEVPEYSRLAGLGAKLAEEPEVAARILADIHKGSEQEGYPLGRALAELGGELATALGRPDERAELLVRAASDAPEDAELLAEAARAAEAGGRTDLLEMLDALLPANERAQSVLERLGQMTTEEALDALLVLDIGACDSALRAPLLVALGERQETLGRKEDAERTYKELLEFAPQNHEALLGLERAAAERDDHEEVLRLLRLRSEATEAPASQRRLVLRRVAILETKLGRSGEARGLLEQLLSGGEDLSALRLLADSWERGGDDARAAELWLRAKAVSTDPSEQDELGFRSAQAFSQAGQERRAFTELSALKKLGRPENELLLKLSRQIGDKQAELAALSYLAEAPLGDAEAQATYTFQAAQLALALGEIEKAHHFASQVGGAGRDAAAGRLLACQLRVQSSPVISKSLAQELLKDLAGDDDVGGAPQREMRSFLRASARALVDGPDAARAELEEAILEQGQRPLLSALLAPLLVSDPERSLSLYEAAIGGELQGMLRESDLLMAASQISRKEGNLARARAFASAVADEDPRRPDAARELEAIAIEITRAERQAREAEAAEARAEAQKLALERARLKEEEEAAQAAQAAEKAAQLAAEKTAQAAEKAAQAKELASKESEGDEVLSVEEVRASELQSVDELNEVEELIAAHPSVPPPPGGVAQAAAVPVVTESTPPVPAGGRKVRTRTRTVTVNPGDLEEVDELSEVEEIAAVHPHREPGAPAPEGDEAAATPIAHAPPSKGLRDEETLVQLLESGDVDAGLELLSLFNRQRNRSRDAVVVASHLTALCPGDARFLKILLEEAGRDKNPALESAVSHILGAYGSGPQVLAPPLGQLEPQPDAAGAVLWRGQRAPVSEALGIVWEYASGLFKRDVGSYGISGVERVPLTAPTALGQLYREAARVLGMTRTPVFRGAPQDGISMHVAVLTPPAVIVSGEVGEASAEMAFHFGAMLAAASPEHVLLFGCEPDKVKDLLEALSAAFGPARPRDAARPSPEATRLSAFFWESVPARSQRRLSQLCDDPEALTLRAVTEYARLVLRRAGLVVSGDIQTAIADACYEGGFNPPTNLTELGEVAHQSSAVQDLLGLAVAPEYAELRFRTSR